MEGGQILEGVIIAASVTIVLALLGVAKWLGSKIATVDTKVQAITERLDRAKVEDTREKVIRLEATAG